jgi:hypothetical protein
MSDPVPVVSLRSDVVETHVSGPRTHAVRWWGHELVRGLAFVVRDGGWGTVPAGLVSREVLRDGRQVRWVAEYGRPESALRVEGEFAVDDERLTATATATVLRDLTTSRTGWVVLLPPSWCGAEYAARESATDRSSRGRLPHEIAPQWKVDGVYRPVFLPFTALSLTRPDGGALTLEVEGDVLEMEDQRNWADASFKVYGPPLHVPWPVVWREGQVHRRRVVVSGAVLGPAPRPGPVTVRLSGDGRTRLRLPQLGTSAPPPGVSPPADAPRVAFLRVDWIPERPNARQSAATALRLAESLGIAAELVARPRGDTLDADVAELRALLAEVPAPSRVLVVGIGEETSTPEAVTATRRAVPDGIPVGGGSDGYLADLNRDPPGRVDWPLLTFGLCPTLHDDDDVAVLQTLEVVEQVLRTGMSLLPGAALHLGPVRLRPRSDERPVDGGGPSRPEGVVGAVWTLGVITAAARAGAAALSLHELAGPEGMAGSVTGRLVEGLQELEWIDEARLERVVVLAGATPRGRSAWVAATLDDVLLSMASGASYVVLDGAVDQVDGGLRLAAASLVRVDLADPTTEGPDP